MKKRRNRAAMNETDRYAGNIIDVQARTRKELLDAAARHAYLAAAPSNLMEIDGGEITNRAGVRQKMTVFVRVEAIGEESDGG
jgi:hypothetical protein